MKEGSMTQNAAVAILASDYVYALFKDTKRTNGDALAILQSMLAEHMLRGLRAAPNRHEAEEATALILDTIEDYVQIRLDEIFPH